MPQIPFEFEFEWPNDLCTAKLPFGHSEMFTPFFIENDLMAIWLDISKSKYLYF